MKRAEIDSEAALQGSKDTLVLVTGTGVSPLPKGRGQECPRPQILLSPSRRIRAELDVETVWIGATVYPECPVWRVWCDGRPVVDTSTAGLADERGPLAYGMRFVKATRHRPQTGIGPGRELRARFASRDGRELEVRLRVTDLSAFCAVREVGRRPSRAHYEQGSEGEAAVCSGAVRRLDPTCVRQGLCITRFPAGSVLLGSGETLNASNPASDLRPPTSADDGPQVRFAPGGKLVAFWRHGLEQHAVFFDRPGDLAARRFGALEGLDELRVADGRQGCEHLFLTVPFTRAALPAPVFGEAVTPAFRAAFELMLGREGASDDFWMLRGEPGEFAVAARRQGDLWRVAGVTAEAQTLTVRFEDLWLRMPAELRALRYTVAILRDPTKVEAGDRVEESFADQAPDVRVALDLAKGGGFVIEFREEAGMVGGVG